MPDFTYSTSCSRTSALLHMCLWLTQGVLLKILKALNRPRKVLLTTVLPSWRLGNLAVCLSNNTLLSLYTDGASVDHWAARTFVLVQCDHYNRPVSAALGFLSLCYSLSYSPFVSVFLHIWFSFRSAVHAGVHSTHITSFPFFSLKLICLVSSALTPWCLGRVQWHPYLHQEYE